MSVVEEVSEPVALQCKTEWALALQLYQIVSLGTVRPWQTDDTRANWTRRLARPIIISKLVAPTTLDAARTLVERHLPAEYRAEHTWQYVSKLLSAPQKNPVREEPSARFRPLRG
jgi:hypothetical protein